MKWQYKFTLQFISDELYGAPVDTNHPYRVYVAPVHIANKVTSTKENFDNAMVFQYKLQLPIDLSGDLVFCSGIMLHRTVLVYMRDMTHILSQMSG